jgi:hypothetical protein
MEVVVMEVVVMEVVVMDVVVMKVEDPRLNIVNSRKDERPRR